MIIREVEPRDLENERFIDDIVRTHVITKRRKKTAGGWTVVDAPFVEDWDAAKRRLKLEKMRSIISAGGVVFGAFADDKLKGFAIVNGEAIGSRKQYIVLESLHVSQELRHMGAGRRLFTFAADWAREHGAEKLYISANSSVDTQAFYAAMGCVEAEEYDETHVLADPSDCQMELIL